MSLRGKMIPCMGLGDETHGGSWYSDETQAVCEQTIQFSGDTTAAPMVLAVSCGHDFEDNWSGGGTCARAVRAGMLVIRINNKQGKRTEQTTQTPLHRERHPKTNGSPVAPRESNGRSVVGGRECCIDAVIESNC